MRHYLSDSPDLPTRAFRRALFKNRPETLEGGLLGGVSDLLFGGAPDAPAPPDPTKTAALQGQANTDAARLSANLSRYNQVTPFGSSTWTQGSPTANFDEAGYNKAMQAYQASQTAQPWYQLGGAFSIPNADQPDVGTAPVSGAASPAMRGGSSVAPTRDQFTTYTPSDQYTNTFKLDPSVQSMLDTFYGKANTGLPQLNTGTLPAIRPIPTADEAGRKAIQDAYYSQETSRLNPQWEQQENLVRSRLANEGITEGSQAYENEMGLFGRNKNDAYSTALNNAIQNSTGQMATLFGMGLGAHSASLVDRNQGINEVQQQRSNALQDRDSILNEIMAMRAGAQVAAPGAGQVSVGTAPVAQSIYNSYQGALNNYNTETAAYNSKVNGLTSMLGGQMMSGGGGGASAGASAGMPAMPDWMAAMVPFTL